MNYGTASANRVSWSASRGACSQRRLMLWAVDTAGPTVELQLAATSYDCVVIGAGVRLPPRRLSTFEAVINAVHKAAPATKPDFQPRFSFATT